MKLTDRLLNILIVDDDPDDHVLTEGYLKSARRSRFVVDHALNVREAREKMRRGGYDVCLLDFALGAIDGVQLFQEVTAEGFSIPTILLSGHDDDDIADLVLEHGLADYVEKRSLNASTLERAILYAIERDASRKEIVELNRSLEVRVRERTYELESFCYSVSHDLRAPLRSINATSAILKEDYGDVLPSTALEELERQQQASARLGNLIDDLLRFVRLGQTEPHRKRIDLTELARSVTDELRISATIDEGLFVDGDETLVRLLVQNLLDNAAKFCGSKSACVEVGREGGAIFVRDHGIGFDPKHANRLFRPFERLHREGDFPGTGIGLANVKRIAERHGGRVWAESTPGEGATFFFTLG